MKRVVVGQRGVGKSNFLKRHHLYHHQVLHFDLDQQIEKLTQKSVSDLFNEFGEKYFREQEIKTLRQLINENSDFCITCGGGVEINQLTDNERSSLEIIYLSRRTDSDGRLFLDRPRLNKEMHALDEYKFRFKERDLRYRDHCDWVYHLPEGLDVVSVLERDFWGQEIISAYYTLTLMSEFEYFKYHRHFELRTDQWSLQEILKIVTEKKEKNFIVSIRHDEQQFEIIYNFIFQLKQNENVKVDLALENLEQTSQILKCFYKDHDDFLKNHQTPQHVLDSQVLITHGSAEQIRSSSYFHQWIISTHESDVNKAILQLNHFDELNHHHNEKVQFFYKLCPQINNWNEFIIGTDWQKINKYNHSFLPRTNFVTHIKSRWRWYRILMLSQQMINFVQGRQDFDDQPSYFEFLMQKASSSFLGSEKLFAAVLGDPVHHSRSPLLQFDFLEQKMNFVSIPLAENEFELALSFLKKFGLKWAAVTSPLKVKAALICDTFQASTLKFSLEKNKLNSVNTLYFSSQLQSKYDLKTSVLGFSTDEVGFQYLLRKLEHKLNLPLSEFSFVLWGGGGVVPALKVANIQFTEYSSRLGKPKYEKPEVQNPDVVIWAAPRHEETTFPSDQWKPKVILDLNYSDHSMGLEYAQKISGVTYISGLKMLVEQGREQFKICKSLMREEGLL